MSERTIRLSSRALYHPELAICPRCVHKQKEFEMSAPKICEACYQIFDVNLDFETEMIMSRIDEGRSPK